MKFKNVLIASDFDGTLKNDDGIITPDVIEKIQYFIENGGLFTVCTGRIFQGFHLYSPEYINAPVLLGNGAMAYDYEKGEVIFQNTTKCQIKNKEEGYNFMINLGYKKFLELNDHNILLSNGKNEICVQDVENLGVYIKMRQNNQKINHNNGDTVEEMINILMEYDLPLDNTNFMAKK